MPRRAYSACLAITQLYRVSKPRLMQVNPLSSGSLPCWIHSPILQSTKTVGVVDNAGGEINFEEVAREDAHAVACFIKMWLRNLPEPLIPSSLRSKVLTIPGITHASALWLRLSNDNNDDLFMTHYCL